MPHESAAFPRGEPRGAFLERPAALKRGVPRGRTQSGVSGKTCPTKERVTKSLSYKVEGSLKNAYA